MSSPRKTRVLIIDDSAMMRAILSDLINQDPSLEVVGTATDPYIGREKILALAPDVVTLDVEMPKMDGLTFLEKLMRARPTRVVLISSLSTKGSEVAMRALELGAIDVVAKPSGDVSLGMQALGSLLREKIKTAAIANLPVATPRQTVTPTRFTLKETTHQILCIAASTGGTEAIKVVLGGLPANFPAILIVQHMPPGFTKLYADGLQRRFPHFRIRETVHGDVALPGTVFIAPGTSHMEVSLVGGQYVLSLHQKEPLHNVRPAADYLLKSAAQSATRNAVGVVLTGMGRDGADGLLAMRQAGAMTYAQDEASSVVFGMPKEAIARGAVQTVLPLDRLATAIASHFESKQAKAA